MITLRSFGPAFGLVDPSPFVTKVDLYMTVCNIKFNSNDDANNLQKAPKDKLPYIEDDGEIICDSTFIIDHLNKKYSVTLDDWLNDEQRALAQLLGKSLDENLYWCIVYSRWINDDTWPIVRERFFGPLPFPMNKIIAFVARRITKKNIIGHGMGRHTNEEVHTIAKNTLSSLATLLGDKAYFFGDKISSFDITAFAMISALTLSTIDNEMTQLAKSFDNLDAYTQRIQQHYYPQS